MRNFDLGRYIVGSAKAKKNIYVCVYGLPTDPVLLLPTLVPPDKSVYWKIIFLIFSTKTYVVGTQKNRLNVTVV